MTPKLPIQLKNESPLTRCVFITLNHVPITSYYIRQRLKQYGWQTALPSRLRQALNKLVTLKLALTIRSPRHRTRYCRRLP